MINDLDGHYLNWYYYSKTYPLALIHFVLACDLALEERVRDFSGIVNYAVSSNEGGV